jgi:hypothetical protein
MNAPIGHPAQVIHATAPPEQKTSTARLAEAVARIRNRNKPKPDDANPSDNPN